MKDITQEHNLDGSVYSYLGDPSDGLLHCENGPAYTCINGDEGWWYMGVAHRDGGPAITESKYGEYWYNNGYLHREGGPAITFTNGELQYWIRGQLHNEEGPAIVRADGRQEWYLFGQRVTQTKFQKYKKCGYGIPKNRILNTQK